MRIAVIAPPWAPVPPAGYGGTEAIVDCLSRGFQRAGHEVMLFTVPESTCPVPQKHVFESAQMNRLNWSEVELKHLIHAYEAIKDFDIVHDHTILGPTYSEHYGDLPVVMTQHHPWNDTFTDIFKASADRVPIVSISHSQASESGDVPIERVIHHGLDPERFTYNSEPEDYFIFLGRMSPNKGAHRAALVAREAGVKLKIAARLTETEGELDYFKKEVEPLLGEGVEFLGEVAGQDKLTLLSNAKGMLNPIRWSEPFGLVMVEAMGSGTPVLAFGEGAAPEIIEHGKTGFISNNEAEMVEHVRRIDEIDRADCRHSAETYFSSDRMVSDYIDLFEDLLERNSENARQTVAEQLIDLTQRQELRGRRPAVAAVPPSAATALPRT